MIHSDFVHLHLHTQYSLLDGAIRIPELIKLAKARKVPALAITDHGNLFGAVEFYQQVQKAGIKPIIGCEVYVAPGSRLDKESRSIADASYHLVLLAKDGQGYSNLIRLVTAGYLEGFYYRPRVDREILRQHCQGLIALSACIKGEVAYNLLRDEKNKARDAARFYQQTFGERFYLEVQENGLAEQKRVNQELLELGQELAIPLVASCDCHYLRQEEAQAHDILLCIQTGKTVNSPDRLKFATDQFYFRTAQEMKELFSWHPEAVQTSLTVAEKCNLNLDFDGFHLPQYSVPQGYSLDGYLEEKASHGLHGRLAQRDTGEGDESIYKERLAVELATIKTMGLSGYFLIVADFINYAKARQIPVGPGRGSAAGSLVAYALKITEVDPLAQNLLFERFLNVGRSSLPDIDVDFCIQRREEVLRYVTEKYGADRVAQITTFGTMQARAVIRDVGRAIDMPYSEVDKIAKLVPPTLNITLEGALAQEPRLRRLAEENEQVATLIRSAKALEGLTRHASTHAAGVVISDRPLTEYTPLYRGARGEVLTQYDMDSLERVGLVKFDFLSLKTLTVIERTTQLVRGGPAAELDLAKVPTDDKKTFDMLCDGDTNGVFQLEGRGITDLVVKLKPERLEDIIAAIALYRPGPLQSGMTDEFIERKHGRLPIEYELPQLRPILEDTYGVIVYQEQVMKIARELAGFTPEEADLLRHAMGKKVSEEMNRQKELFISGAKKRGIKQRKASRIFDLMAHFAGYGFNKSHSAAYAVISYHTAYLKAHYPLEFMAALLSSEMDNSDKLMRYIAECRQKGLEVLPPDINESEQDFTVVGGKIRFGLAAVKNVGVGAIKAILESRKSAGEFSSVFDLCQRVDLRRVNRRVVESLIKAGAFDSPNKNRSKLLAGLKEAMDKAQASQRDREQGQFSLFASVETNAPFVGHEPDADVETSPDTNMVYENEVLGLYLSDHPLRPYLAALEPLGATPIKDIAGKQDGTQVTLAGLVGNLKEKFTKKGQLMAFLTLEDLTGQLEVIVFSELFKEVSSLLSSGKPLVVQGVLDVAEEGTKAKATKIWQVTDPEPLTASVHITLSEESLAQESLLAMKAILKKCPGTSPAYLHLVLKSGKEALIALEERVAPSERLAQELRQLLGDNAVAFTQLAEN